MYALMRIESGEEFHIKPYPDKGEGKSLVVWMDAEDNADLNRELETEYKLPSRNAQT